MFTMNVNIEEIYCFNSKLFLVFFYAVTMSSICVRVRNLRLAIAQAVLYIRSFKKVFVRHNIINIYFFLFYNYIFLLILKYVKPEKTEDMVFCVVTKQ